jgi:hypothetical protein
MAQETKTGLWATDDGSFGDGEVTIVDTSEWSKKQWKWYEDLADSGEVTASDLQDIDNEVKPEGID